MAKGVIGMVYAWVYRIIGKKRGAVFVAELF